MRYEWDCAAILQYTLIVVLNTNSEYKYLFEIMNSLTPVNCSKLAEKYKLVGKDPAHVTLN